MKQTNLISLALCAAISLGLLAGCGGGGPQPTDSPQPTTSPAAVPESAPPPSSDASQEENSAAALGSLASFTAGTLDGGTFTQDDISAKDVTVVNFWSLTCGPCIAEMPALAEFAKALPDNVQVVTVCLDGYGNEEFVVEVLQTAGYEGVTLISGDGDLAALCGNLMYTPTTLFADSEGALVGSAVIGGKADLAGVFTEAVNQVLTAGGKDEISLETESSQSE